MKRKGVWIGGLALAVVVGAAVTISVVTDYTDGERPGAAFPLTGRIDSEHDAEVKLPLGTLTVQVGSPSQEYDTAYNKTRRAADGAVVVPVGWDIPGAQVAVSNSLPVLQFQLTLVADGRRYDLQTGYEEEPERTPSVPIVASGAVAAVVEGDGADLELEVEYDGLTQVLDVDSGKIDSGLAAPYYAKGGLKQLSTGKSCSALSDADARTLTASLDNCTLGPVILEPYIGGLGWVDKSTESWARVRYSLLVGSIYTRGNRASYSTEARRFDVTLDGVRPTADLLRYRDRSSASLGGTKVFGVSKTPKTLGLTTELVGDGTFNKLGTRVFRTTRTFPLR